jgi:hypothetical protein
MPANRLIDVVDGVGSGAPAAPGDAAAATAVPAEPGMMAAKLSMPRNSPPVARAVATRRPWDADRPGRDIDERDIDERDIDERDND